MLPYLPTYTYIYTCIHTCPYLPTCLPTSLGYINHRGYPDFDFSLRICLLNWYRCAFVVRALDMIRSLTSIVIMIPMVRHSLLTLTYWYQLFYVFIFPTYVEKHVYGWDSKNKAWIKSQNTQAIRTPDHTTHTHS